MDFGTINLTRLMKAKMAYSSQRNDQIASNIANYSVPGYKAHDLKPVDFSKLAEAESRRLAMRATSPKHLTGNKGAGANDYRDEKMRKTYETIPVKNNVVLEEQSKNLAMNAMEYQTVVNLYSKYAAMFKMANGSR
jgi:flagellar basal-body rod protein FlgB